MLKFFYLLLTLLCISCSDLKRVNEYDDLRYGLKAPTGVVAVQRLYSSTIKITWFANTENSVKGYNLYRSTNSNGPYGKINSSLIRLLSEDDYNGLVYDTTYYYKVTAVDYDGNESRMSNYSSVYYYRNY